MIGFARTGAILLAITLGALLPQAHVLAGAIRWLIMVMLFLVFLQTRLSGSALNVYDLMNADVLVVTTGALKGLEETFGS